MWVVKEEDVLDSILDGLGDVAKDGVIGYALVKVDFCDFIGNYNKVTQLNISRGEDIYTGKKVYSSKTDPRVISFGDTVFLFVL